MKKKTSPLKPLAEALRKDEGYFVSYQANIAMAYFDEARRQGSKDSCAKLHNIANKAAHYFLNLLITPSGKPYKEYHPLRK